MLITPKSLRRNLFILVLFQAGLVGEVLALCQTNTAARTHTLVCPPAPSMGGSGEGWARHYLASEMGHEVANSAGIFPGCKMGFIIVLLASFLVRCCNSQLNHAICILRIGRIRIMEPVMALMSWVFGRQRQLDHFTMLRTLLGCLTKAGLRE